MGKSSRRNRPSKAQRKKNAIVARNNNFYNVMNCKSTSRATRALTGGPGRDNTRLMNEFKKANHADTHRTYGDFNTDYVSWSPLM